MDVGCAESALAHRQVRLLKPSLPDGIEHASSVAARHTSSGVPSQLSLDDAV